MGTNGSTELYGFFLRQKFVSVDLFEFDALNILLERVQTRFYVSLSACSFDSGV